MKSVYLKPKKEQAVQRMHPWIFSGAIKSKEGNPSDGDTVEVYSHKGQYLATGHFQEGSIAVRVLTFHQHPIDDTFWTGRLTDALRFRQNLGFPVPGQTDCYRLVHGSGDYLPGLVIDIYGTTAVMQCHSIGMHQERNRIAGVLMDLIEGLEGVFDKSAESLPGRYAAGVNNSFVTGSAGPKEIRENGHIFHVNWEEGQKTGFFIDQRENRSLLCRYAAGKKILNAFCYSGGFSVYALAAGAQEVHSLDLSTKAMEWTDKHVALNPHQSLHQSYTGDVLTFLKKCDLYDLMVVDPPAFAKHPGKRHNAVQGYKRLNAMAMKKLKAGGLLFTFSCSQVIDRNLFYNTLVAAALEAGRKVKVLHHLSQPPDHPVNLFHPEGAYLKGLVLRVEE